MSKARSSTADALERYEGQAAFGEAINLLGCALPHPEGRNFQGHRGAHTLSTAVRFAVHCRRRLELKSAPNDNNLCCALEFEGDFARGACALNLKQALHQLIHNDHVLISDVRATFKNNSKGAVHFQKQFFDSRKKASAVVMKVTTPERDAMIIPLVVMLDAYFLLLPGGESLEK
ncbi:hypothetical protein [Hyphococcus luteus]|uniref:hypothetical protein n=1 Tax=Hyphococcus luteus TaxID=2058213 RepID=UPI00105703F2|nr:hypothetical protein [Marinicaulis flavus]